MTEIVQQPAFPAFAKQEDSTSRHESFAAMVQRQSRFVFRVAYSVLRSVSEADDVVQETFLKVYRAGGWERIENERAFLARVAWRAAVDRRRVRRVEEPDPELASQAESPEAVVIAADWSAAVHRLIDALPEEFRQPLALSAVEEMSSPEIAAVMGIPEGTVRSRISRARQLLREKLNALVAGGHGR